MGSYEHKIALGADGVWRCLDEDRITEDCSDEHRCEHQCVCNDADALLRVGRFDLLTYEVTGDGIGLWVEMSGDDEPTLLGDLSAEMSDVAIAAIADGRIASEA